MQEKLEGKNGKDGLSESSDPDAGERNIKRGDLETSSKRRRQSKTDSWEP